MSHFYGVLQGSRGRATRCGTKQSEMDTTAASWEGAVSVRLYHNAEEGRDYALVELTKWHGAGSNRELYRGPVDGRDLTGLKLSAEESAKSRGHTLDKWIDGPAGNYAVLLCKKCGKTVSVDLNPTPSGVDISGPAVAVDCED